MYQAQDTGGVWSDITKGEVATAGCSLPATVKMQLNQSRYTASDPLRVDMVVNGDAMVDLYIAVVFPSGDFMTIGFPEEFSWVNIIEVYQPNV